MRDILTVASAVLSSFGSALPSDMPESRKSFCKSVESANFSSWLSNEYGQETTKPWTGYSINTYPGDLYSISSDTYTGTVYKSWMPDRKSECFCELCYVYAEFVQLLVWPHSTTELAVTSFVSDGYTFHSPTVYLKLYDVTVADACGYRGKTLESTILPHHASQIRVRLATTVAPLIDLDSLRTDCHGNYTKELSTVDSSVYAWDACYPSLVLTATVSTEIPNWKDCALMNNILDPPMFLTPAARGPTNPVPSPGPAPGLPADPTTHGVALSTRQRLDGKPTQAAGEQPAPAQPIVDTTPQVTTPPGSSRGGSPNGGTDAVGQAGQGQAPQAGSHIPPDLGVDGQNDPSRPQGQAGLDAHDSGSDSDSNPQGPGNGQRVSQVPPQPLDPSIASDNPKESGPLGESSSGDTSGLLDNPSAHGDSPGTGAGAGASGSGLMSIGGFVKMVLEMIQPNGVAVSSIAGGATDEGSGSPGSGSSIGSGTSTATGFTSGISSDSDVNAVGGTSGKSSSAGASRTDHWMMASLVVWISTSGVLIFLI